jgi:tRNA threonylcarbamoyladenosine biosynthesis protein TsaB
VLIALDARMNEVYWAAYRQAPETHAGTGARWETVVAPAVSAPGSVSIPSGENWIAAGDGFAAYPALAARIGATLRIDAAVRLTARSIAALALRGVGTLTDAAHAVPHYIRDRVALTTVERIAARTGVPATAAPAGAAR